METIETTKTKKYIATMSAFGLIEELLDCQNDATRRIEEGKFPSDVYARMAIVQNELVKRMIAAGMDMEQRFEYE